MLGCDDDRELGKWNRRKDLILFSYQGLKLFVIAQNESQYFQLHNKVLV